MDADRGRDAVPHILNGLKGTPGGMTPFLKIQPKLPKAPDLTKGVSDAERKRYAAALKEFSDATERSMKSMRITGFFGMAFRHVADEQSFVQLVNETKRIFARKRD